MHFGRGAAANESGHPERSVAGALETGGRVDVRYSDAALKERDMAIVVRDDECCPYCKPPFSEFTDDHIFPQFLGGRRTIRVCRKCNSSFGHSFEGSASRQIKRLQVFISHFGLDLTKNAAIWPSALIIDDVTYDLVSGPEGVQYKLSKPVIIRDADGRIVGGKARSRVEANRFVKELIASGKAKEVVISEEPGQAFNDIKLETSFSFDQDLFRFATKLAAALTVDSGNGQLISSSGIPAYLHMKGNWPTSVAYCNVSAVRKLRPPLTHTVYIELSQRSYAIVLIFGFKKIFVPLPPSVLNKGVLATLDPITGEEDFREVSPIGPISVPHVIAREAALVHLQEMYDVLTEESTLRGAKHPPDLKLVDIDLGKPQPLWWSDITLRFGPKP